MDNEQNMNQNIQHTHTNTHTHTHTYIYIYIYIYILYDHGMGGAYLCCNLVAVTVKHCNNPIQTFAETCAIISCLKW